MIDHYKIVAYKDEQFTKPEGEISQEEADMLYDSMIGRVEVEFRGQKGVCKKFTTRLIGKERKVYFELELNGDDDE